MQLSLEKLDKILWGLHKQDLVIIAGRPSEGKTSLSLQIASEMAVRKKTTYFLSLETSRTSVLERLFCQYCEVNNQVLRRGEMMDSEEMKEKMTIFKNWVTEQPFLIVDRLGYKFKDIISLVDTVRPRPEILVIDYIQMISSWGGNKVEIISDYIRQLKEMAVEHNFVAIVTSQISRAPMERSNKRPTLSDLKGSGSLEEGADVVMTLYWNAKNGERADPNKFEIAVLKQRDGMTGLVVVDFLPQYYKFVNRREL